MPKEYIGRIEALDACYNGWNMDASTIEAITVNIGRIPAADVVEVVRCRDCIHRPFWTGVNHDMKFPDEECPCQCSDALWYSCMPPDDWYCPHGERKDGGQDE